MEELKHEILQIKLQVNQLWKVVLILALATGGEGMLMMHNTSLLDGIQPGSVALCKTAPDQPEGR